MSIPNLLSLIRIFSVVPIIILFIYDFYFLSLIVFIFAALTDFFDGYLARKLNLESNLGSLLDLLADKILISSLLIWFVFSFDDFLIFISSFFIILREILVSSIRIHFLSTNLNLDEIKPNSLGKVKTSSQMVAIAMVLISPYMSSQFFLVASLLLFSSSILSQVSLYNYYSSWIKK